MLNIIHSKKQTACLNFYQVFKYVQEMLPGVRVIRGLHVSKDICPRQRWSEAMPALQSNGSQRPAERLLLLPSYDGRAPLCHTVGAGPQNGQPGALSSTKTLSQEF